MKRNLILMHLWMQMKKNVVDDRLSVDVLHFDMACDDFDEFEDVSPIREITELETVYDRKLDHCRLG